ncbi:MAG: hypothetical protein VW333_05805 [Pseudomonadales bacterium]|jgi:hypothetical protein
MYRIYFPLDHEIYPPDEEDRRPEPDENASWELHFAHHLKENLPDCEIEYFWPTTGERLEIKDLDIDVEWPDWMSRVHTMYMLIAQMERGQYIILDSQDEITNFTKLLWKDPSCLRIYAGQYNLERYENYDPPFHKLRPGIYWPYRPLSFTKEVMDEIRETRLELSLNRKLDTKVHFYGNNSENYVVGTWNGYRGPKNREVLDVLQTLYPDEVDVGSTDKMLPLLEFYKKSATHMINLALPGHPWCSREHELWHLGLPVMKYEARHELFLPVQANVHYIGVPSVLRWPHEPAINPEVAAHSIMKVHKEWIQHPVEVEEIGRKGGERAMNNTPWKFAEIFKNTVMEVLGT